MRAKTKTFTAFLAFATLLVTAIRAQSTLPAAPQSGDTAQAIDGLAARIGEDIITESEVRELAAFQRVVDGKSKPRTELIRELADQWTTRGEADAAKFPEPSPADVDKAYVQLAMQLGGANEFSRHTTAVGLNETTVRLMLKEQLYLSRFLDYRFRPAVQVDDAQIEAYYRDELSPQVKSRGQPVPPLENVQETIREVLVQRAITQRANEWLDDARTHLQIETLHEGGVQ